MILWLVIQFAGLESNYELVFVGKQKSSNSGMVLHITIYKFRYSSENKIKELCKLMYLVSCVFVSAIICRCSLEPKNYIKTR